MASMSLNYKGYLNIIGCDSTEVTSGSCHLFFDAWRALFNVPAGSQRFCLEHKIRLSKVKHIFITGLHWKNLGGLPGMLLTMADCGVNSVQITGPKNILSFIGSLRQFMGRPKMELTVTELEDNEDIEPIHIDEFIRLKPVILSAPFESSSFMKEHSLTDHGTLDPQIKKLRSSAADTSDLSNSSDLLTEGVITAQYLKKSSHVIETVTRPYGNRSTFKLIGPNMAQLAQLPHDGLWNVACYIVQTPDIPGKFDPKKAQELGLEKGPNYGLLTKGQSVETKDGKIIHPSDCISPPTPGTIFMIIECPSIHHLDSLLNKKVWEPYCNGGKHAKQLAYIIHITPASIMESPDYQKWISKFPSHTHHIVLNREHCPSTIGYKGSFLHQCKLNQINPSLFQIPHTTETGKPFPSTMPKLTRAGVSQLKLLIGQLPAIDTSEQIVVSKDQVAEAISKFEVYLSQLSAEERKLIADLPKQSSVSEQPELVFLGTGAAIPSKYRNVSAIYLDMKKYGGALLDCGEGSYGQLLRRFGRLEVDNVVKNMKLIFISHIHADHHLGTPEIILEHQKLHSGADNYVPILIIGPRYLYSWLKEYSTKVQKLHFSFVDCAALTDANKLDLNLYSFLENSLGLKSIQTVSVIHCNESYALIIDHQLGWKLVYSGDTRPCEKLIEAGKNATVLIHEATFEDSMGEEAVDKNHSTTQEAIDIGIKMNAERIILTHFSQRYPKIPIIDSKYEDKICIASDLMNIPFDYLSFVPKLLPALKCLYKELEEEEKKEDDSSSV